MTTNTHERVLIIVPTYNECGNVTATTAAIRASVPDAHILIADDNSPDGTGEVADQLAESDSHIHVLHRAGKQGLGAAYLASFQWAKEQSFDIVVEMDADGSHRAEDLPALLGALSTADVVLGSRWTAGGRVVNWPKSREALSRGGNLYTQIMLGIPLRDATGGFRAFRMSALDRIDLTSVQSQGYCFQVDLAWRAVRAGLQVVEVPITFIERTVGESKMSKDIVREALLLVTRWGIRHRISQVTSLFSSART